MEPMPEPLFLIVTIKPDRGRLQDAAEQLGRMRQASLQEPGCVSMTLLQEVDDQTDTWVMVEQFASREAWDEHMASDHNRRGNELLEPLLREPSRLQLLHRHPINAASV
jgi:quinol monooxygenase YgiN